MADKNLFAYNITDNEDNDRADDNPFIATRLSDSLSKRSDENTEALFSNMEKKILRMPELIAGAVLLMAGLVFLFRLVDLYLNQETPRVSLGQLLQENVLFIALGVICLLCGIIILILRNKKVQSYENSDEHDSLMTDAEALGREISLELDIPDTTTSVDILPYNYKMIDGEEREYIEQNVYQNLELTMWRDGECLCITDHACVMRIPLSAFAGYYEIDTKYTISMWWKDTEYNKGEYKQYKIRQDSDFNYRLHTYYDVVINEGEDQYDLLIPCYDFPAFLRLVDLKCLDGDPIDASVSEI